VVASTPFHTNITKHTPVDPPDFFYYDYMILKQYPSLEVAMRNFHLGVTKHKFLDPRGNQLTLPGISRVKEKFL